MHDVLRFWLDLGAVGFRVDVAHGLAKDPELPDMDYGSSEAGGATDQDRVTARLEHPHWDRDEVHDIIRGWRSVLDEYPGSVMVAEAWVANWSRLVRYLRPDEFHQVFDFDFLESDWDAGEFRKAIDESLGAAGSVGSIPTWVLSNHDLVRHATRYGLPPNTASKSWLLDGDRSDLDAVAGHRRARAAALLMLSLPGSCYVYQGEELGLPEVHDLPGDVLDDPVWLRSGRTEKGRDGCRVPVPWTPEGSSFGFGDNGSWLPQPDDWGRYSVASQDGVSSSTLELYRTAFALRRDLLTGDEDLTWLELGDDVLAFQRGSGVVCVVNLSQSPIPLPEGQVLVSSEPLTSATLPPDTAAWIR